MGTPNQAVSTKNEKAVAEFDQPQGIELVDWRQSKWLALVELAIVALIFVADNHHLIRFSKTPYLLVLGWISLRVRKLRWKDVGFTLNRSWTSTLALGLGAGIILEIIELFITQPLLAHLTGKPPDLEGFRMLTGNIKYTAITIALVWTVAAFGEELVWRGYVMNRVADLGNKTRFAWFCSLIVVHVAFGLAHSYQGLTGIIQEGFAGLLLGLIYLGSGKNLSVPIVAHGVSDTLDILLIFLGKFPGL
jgi:membrane protease YdiL (CAAX protease family)